MAGNLQLLQLQIDSFLLLLDLQRHEFEAQERRAAAREAELSNLIAKLKLMAAKEVEDAQAHAHEDSVQPEVITEDVADSILIIEENSALVQDETKLLPLVCASDTSTRLETDCAHPVTSNRLQTFDTLAATFTIDIISIAALLISHANTHAFVVIVKGRIMVEGFVRRVWLIAWNLRASSFQEGEYDEDQHSNFNLFWKLLFLVGFHI